MFQPRGYGPIRLMKDALVDCFARELNQARLLLMPEPVYFGGTVDRSIRSREIIAAIEHRVAMRWPFQTVTGTATLWSGWPAAAIGLSLWGRTTIRLSQFARALLTRLEAANVTP